MTDEDVAKRLKEIERRLGNIEGDMNRVQGNVNVLARIQKEDRRDVIKALANRAFGQSDNRRKVWFYADDTDAADIAEKTGIRLSNVRRQLANLNNQGLVVKEERNGTTYYDKAGVVKGVGLEQDVKDEVDSL